MCICYFVYLRQVKNHTVSWIRNRDSAILSIDSDTIIHDKRISVIQTRVRGDYVLAIRWLGSFLRQKINKDRKSIHFLMSQFIWLDLNKRVFIMTFNKNPSWAELEIKLGESEFAKGYTTQNPKNVSNDLFEKFIILWENSLSNLYIPFYVFPVKLYPPSSMLHILYPDQFLVQVYFRGWKIDSIEMLILSNSLF